ncbi:hypothetical protein GCM10020258_40410 [Sphingomonas yabuuchiae]
MVFADNGFALHQLRLAHGAGAYADQGGRIVDRWSSQWERPELWLFDFHHHLFASDIGETVIGIAGLCGLFFVVSGAILWWRTRRTFKWRLLPKRMSRPAILMHHRDLGIIVAPLLLLSSITGAAMVFRPVAMIVVAPFGSPAKALAALRPGKVHGGPLAASPPWQAMLTTASRRFPDAVPRILTMPRKPGTRSRCGCAGRTNGCPMGEPLWSSTPPPAVCCRATTRWRCREPPASITCSIRFMPGVSADWPGSC